MILALQTAFAAYPAPIKSKIGMVTTSHKIASEIGMQILKNGGNAFDAAVAVGFALAVVHPSAGNLGGGGFAVIHTRGGQSFALDFREIAPKNATRDMYLDAQKNPIKDLSIIGYLAAGVPGTVKGLFAMHEKFGSLDIKTLMAPAIALAENGFEISARQEQTMAAVKDDFAKFESSRKYFLKPDGSTYRAGETFVQQDLARTLRAIQNGGEKEFYEGEIAHLIAQDMAKNGGLITLDDLKNYSVKWREPVRGTYRGHEILTMSPGGGGALVVEILNIMENAPVKDFGFGSAKKIHIMAEAMRQAYVDRTQFFGDPDFVEVPLTRLLSKSYAKEVYERVKNRVVPSESIKFDAPQPHESNQTTHFSIADGEGNAVSLTYTINGSYGSAAAVNGAGFLLNNEMDDFSIKPGVPNLYGLLGSTANEISPQKRPLSSMSPTIVLKNGRLFMVVGTPGGSRIITTVVQVISNVIDHEMDISEAALSPRVHMQYLPDEIRYEKNGLNPDTAAQLREMGYTLVQKPLMGDVNAVMVLDDASGRSFLGVMDVRREF